MIVTMHYRIANEIHRRLSDVGIRLNKPLFVLGNLVPDISPATITKPHSYSDSFLQTGLMIKKLCSGVDAVDSPSFSMTIGKVMHYICDYFCFPHTLSFHDNFGKHLLYECKQKFPKKDLLANKQKLNLLTTPSQIIRSIKKRVMNYEYNLKNDKLNNNNELLYAIETATAFAFSICKISNSTRFPKTLPIHL